MKKAKILLLCMVLVFSAAAVWADALTALQSGADRLKANQNTDGGWGWPLTGSSASNTIGPIGMGLAQAYRFVNPDTAALQNVGAFLWLKQILFHHRMDISPRS